MVLLREGYIYFHFLADFSAYQLLLEAGNKCAGADGQGVILAFSTFKGNTVYKTFKVNYGVIAILYGTVFYIDGSCTLFPLFIDFCFHFLIGNGCVDLVNLYPFVFAEFYFGFQRNFCSEDKRLAGLNLYDINLGSGNDFFLTFSQCFVVSIGNQGIGCIFVENANTVHALNHFTGCFTLTETGDGDFVFLILVSFFDCFLKLVSIYLNGKLRHVIF